MDAVELSALKLRVSLMEEILIRVWVSELATTAARNRADAQQIAERTLSEVASAICAKIPSEKCAFSVFASHVEHLKSLVHR
jgi:hypothetical protein